MTAKLRISENKTKVFLQKQHFLIGKVLKMRKIVYLCMVFHTLWGFFNYN